MFGSLSGAIGIAIVVAAFGDFGVNGWTIRALAHSPAAIGIFRQTLTAKLTLATILGVAWVAISLVALNSSLKIPIALLAGYLLSLIVAGTLTVPFRASENMTVVSVVGALEKAVTLAVWLVIQAHGGHGLEALPIALVAGGTASVVCALVLIPRRFLAIASPSFRDVFDLWRSSYSFGMVGVSAQIQRVDVAIVSGVAGPYAAGVYAAPARMAGFLAVIPASFSAAVFPRIARSSRDGSSRRPEFLGAAAVLALMALLLVVGAIAAPVLVPLALGKAYLSSVGVLRIYLLAVFVNSANQPLLAFLQADGYEHYVGRAMIAAAIVGLLAIAGGGYVYGAVGAAAGALILQLLQMSLFSSKALRAPRRLIATQAAADVADGSLDIYRLATEVSDNIEGS